MGDPLRHFEDKADEAFSKGLLVGLASGLIGGAFIMLTSLIVGGALK